MVTQHSNEDSIQIVDMIQNQTINGCSEICSQIWFYISCPAPEPHFLACQPRHQHYSVLYLLTSSLLSSIALFTHPITHQLLMSDFIKEDTDQFAVLVQHSISFAKLAGLQCSGKWKRLSYNAPKELESAQRPDGYARLCMLFLIPGPSWQLNSSTSIRNPHRLE